MRFRDSKFFLDYRSWIIAAAEAFLVCCGLVSAWLLRFDFGFPFWRLLLASAPVLVVIRLVMLWRFRLLHGWWRYTGIYDVVGIAKAIMAGSIVFFLLTRYVLLGNAYPRSIYILEGVITGG